MRLAALLGALKGTKRPLRKPWMALEVVGTFSLSRSLPLSPLRVNKSSKGKGSTNIVGERLAQRHENSAFRGWPVVWRGGKLGPVVVGNRVGR